MRYGFSLEQTNTHLWEDLFPDRIPRRVDAEPGVYVVELEIDGEVQRTTLEVRADPIDAR